MGRGVPGRRAARGAATLAAIQAAKARLDERGREPGQDRNPRGGRPYQRAYGEPEPKAQSNFTDPESQIMKTSSEGFQQCYNAQMAVDGEHQIIVATQVGPQASDQGRLVGLLDEINETFGAEPAVVLAERLGISSEEHPLPDGCVAGTLAYIRPPLNARWTEKSGESVLGRSTGPRPGPR